MSKKSPILDKTNTIKFLKKSLENENLELECVFDSMNINKIVFLRILDSLKSINDFVFEDLSLDIKIQDGYQRFSDIRITINGLENIKKYCKTDSLEDIDDIIYLKKEFYKETNDTDTDIVYRINNDDYNYRLNVKSEIELSKENPIVEQTLTDFKSKIKHYRYKKRYSFISYDKLFRFDITVVKMSDKHSRERSFKDANILNRNEIYEIEIEYIGSKTSDDGTKQIEQLFKDLSDMDDKDEYISPYLKKSSDPNGLLSPMEFDEFGNYIPPGYSENTFKPETNFQPEIPIYEPVFKGTVSEGTPEDYIKTQIKEMVGNIDMFEELIDELKSDETEKKKEFLEIIEKFKDEKRELKKQLKEKKTHSGGAKGKKKLPDWAKQKQIPLVMDNDLLSEKLYEFFTEHIYYILSLIYDSQHILSNTEKIDILQSYKNLTNQKVSLRDIKLQLPQPVTLNLNDINPDNPNSILLKYAVTDKADGDRYMMYIKDNHGYLINSKKNVIDTGVDFPDLNKDYIFDGEYITKDADNNDIKLFMIFDIYYIIAGKVVNYIHKLPFHTTAKKTESRYNLIQDFKNTVLTSVLMDEYSIEIDAKIYEFGKYGSKEDIGSDKYLSDCKTILTKCNKILEKEDKNILRYRIDGLIFLPLFNAVKSKNNTDMPNNIGGKWEQNFKWKPPEENTIDFQVKYVKEKVNQRMVDKIVTHIVKNPDGSEYLGKYKQLQLFVGYSKKEDKSIDFCMRILDDIVEDRGKIIPFSPDDDRILYTTNVPIDPITKKIICERDSREILEDDLVEMKYVPDAKNHMIWEPLRIRDDKFPKVPQFFTIANSVWSTIKYPVTTEFIRNKVSLKDYKESLEEDTTKYYVSENNSFITEPLRKFHNYIKTKLITGVGSSFKEKINILDLSIGRGGDINKYIHRDTNAKFILGIDISSNVNEACERYYNQRKDKPPAVFLVGDTSQNISMADCYEDLDSEKMEKQIKHSEMMLNILYNLKRPVPKEYKNIQKKYNNLALKKFNMISTQFTLHYYFEDNSTFEGFMKNIKDNIAPKGYFIGCCYDGKKIFNKLKEGDIEFRDDTGNLVYSIKKKYDLDDFEFDPDSEDNEKMFGQTIDVYMESIGQEIPEYLVNFDFLKKYMEDNGFKLVSPTVKKQYSYILKSNNITNGFGDFEKVIQNLPEIRDADRDLQDEGIYSDALNLLKNTSLKKDGSIKTLGCEMLRLLSSFNNYFIFQKV
jgi:hypothetical protein